METTLSVSGEETMERLVSRVVAAGLRNRRADGRGAVLPCVWPGAGAGVDAGTRRRARGPVLPVSWRAPAGRLPAHVMMTLPDFFDRLPPGRDVMFLNSSAPAAPFVPADDPPARWGQTTGESAPGGPGPDQPRPSTDSGTPSKRGQDE
ncbi:hypothetical protein OG413_29920 [Streptomyces sp. NBC_01433]|uniref:hypothetical protein n=1 Tax=Streptomyces sp. NBC_01433 TaxID=2903864 RepID=UPI00224F6D17|nr:hypothetical protein [Streptomyces sp. NBC_01433]MCX4679454.1 hypothetical protein [Streptomyces sp. NBC_01433]